MHLDIIVNVMRVAVYGGSFDPPHVGHLLVAAWLRWTGQADEVWFLVSYAHPFSKDSSPFEVRAGLCDLVVEQIGARVCRVEAELPSPSYTIDVLDVLASRHPEHTLRFVHGADLLAKTGSWKDWDTLRERYRPIVVGRRGFPVPPDSVVFPEVSSTDVRRRVRAGESVAHLVPACILEQVVTRYAADPPADRTDDVP